MQFDGQRVCGVPDHVGNESCLWPFLDVAVFASGKLGQVNMADAAEFACAAWSAVCGIRLVLTNNSRTAHIVMGSGTIDGPNGTLAWSELPCGFAPTQWRQLQQKYDTGELWTLAENPPNDRIDAGRVVCHELGHALGAGHGQSGNLMAPTYSRTIRLPQRGDILEMVDRYGKRADAPPTPPVPPPTPEPPTQPPTSADVTIMVSFGGKTYSGTLRQS